MQKVKRIIVWIMAISVMDNSQGNRQKKEKIVDKKFK